MIFYANKLFTLLKLLTSQTLKMMNMKGQKLNNQMQNINNQKENFRNKQKKKIDRYRRGRVKLNNQNIDYASPLIHNQKKLQLDKKNMLRIQKNEFLQAQHLLMLKLQMVEEECILPISQLLGTNQHLRSITQITCKFTNEILVIIITQIER
ncbi:unnamed protein product [Paramecium octaurelia]|uniref:Transmembrane protein n=1 Tax=Paramecium octaurelia TaxID=43137 RepID=A0A8S1TN39_PAROT|nr:unnamed protein product [Paramecium octaurelia]